MFSLRPAYPRGVYVLGVIVSVFLVLVSAYQPAAPAPPFPANPATAASTQILVMDID